MRPELRNAAPLALLLLAAAVYWPGLAGPFLLDDFSVLFALRAPPPDWRLWFDALLASDLDYSRLRLLSNLSFMLNDVFAGAPDTLSPWPYKATNLALHLGCGAAAWLVALRLALAVDPGCDPARARRYALFVAALFLLHPLQVSTVLYAVQRMAILSAGFTLLALLAWLDWHRHAALRGGIAALARLLPVGVLIAFACLSKENGVLALPLLLLLACVLPDGAADTPAAHARRLARRLLAFLTLLLVVGLALRAPDWLTGYEIRDFTLIERVATQAYVLAGYLGQIVWPRPATMSLYHDAVPIASLTAPATWGIWLLLVGAAAAAFALRRRWPLPALALPWFLICHALESTVIPLELAFEHRNYLAIIGPALLGGAPLLRPVRAPVGTAVAGFAIALLATLAVLTAQRVAQWSDYERFLAGERRAEPASLRARLAEVALRLQQNRVAEARALADDTLARAPASANAAIPALTIGCGSDEVAAPALAEALRRFTGPGLEGDADRHMLALVRAKAAGSCAGYDWPKLLSVIDAALGNPVTRAHRLREVQWTFVRALATLHASEATAALHYTRRLRALEPARLRFLLLHRRVAADAGDEAELAAALLALRAHRARDPLFPQRFRPELGTDTTP